MGSNRKLLLGVLLLVGAVVLIGLYNMIGRVTAPPATPTPVPQAQLVSQRRGGRIAKAIVDIPQGSIVTKDMFEMVPLTGTGLPTGFVTDPETQAIGYITRTDIPRGAQLRPNEDFVGHITEVGIAAALRPGTRAMVIPFANKPTLHDLVRIGNFIDVNAAFDNEEARTIVPGVRVLAVDVFGNDFPQVNVAMRGPYKADPKPGTVAGVGPGVTTASGAPVDPNATPTPAPTAAPARPEPAITVEVTSQQANAILLAQASGATLDFVVLPALRGNRTSEPVPAPGPDGVLAATTTRPVFITRTQLAPNAARKRNPAPQTTKVDMGLKDFGKSMENIYKADSGKTPNNWPAPTGDPAGPGLNPMPVTTPAPAPPATYDIPIYADGKTVRVETVRRPQD